MPLQADVNPLYHGCVGSVDQRVQIGNEAVTQRVQKKLPARRGTPSGKSEDEDGSSVWAFFWSKAVFLAAPALA
jgi:hypothetical protein